MSGVVGALAVVLALILGACGDGGGDNSAQAYDSYARAFCLATNGFVSSYERLQPRQPDGSIDVAVLVPAWDEFIRDLRAARPPADLRDWHDAYLVVLQQGVDRLRGGDTSPPYDPFDEGPEPPVVAWQRMTDAMSRAPECQRTPSPTPAVSQPATATPSPAGLPAVSIDYSAPSRYLASGPQSTLTPGSIAVLDAGVGSVGQGIPTLAAIYRWMQAYFRTEPLGGGTIGKAEVNSLIGGRVLSGCHDWALVMTTALRHFGYPSIMVDTAGIQWAEDFRAGRASGDVGHVLAEVYVDGDWLLVDCTAGTYTADYDPQDRFIPLQFPGESRGLFVLFKGTDPASYGISSGEDLHKAFVAFAGQLPALEFQPPTYRWQSLQQP